MFPQELVENGSRLHTGSAMQPPSPLCAWHIGSRRWVSCREAVPSDHSNTPGHPTPTLYHHTSLLPFQNLAAHTLQHELHELHEHCDLSGGFCVFCLVTLSLRNLFPLASYVIQVRHSSDAYLAFNTVKSPGSRTTEPSPDSPLTYTVCDACVDLLAVAQPPYTPPWSVL